MISVTSRLLIFKTVNAERKPIDSRVTLFYHHNGSPLLLPQILSRLGLYVTWFCLI